MINKTGRHQKPQDINACHCLDGPLLEFFSKTNSIFCAHWHAGGWPGWVCLVASAIYAIRMTSIPDDDTAGGLHPGSSVSSAQQEVLSVRTMKIIAFSLPRLYQG